MSTFVDNDPPLKQNNVSNQQQQQGYFYYKLGEDILHKVSDSASVKSLASLLSFIPFFSVLMPRESSSFSHQFYRSGFSISARFQSFIIMLQAMLNSSPVSIINKQTFTTIGKDVGASYVDF
jgi:hypothetical protein